MSTTTTTKRYTAIARALGSLKRCEAQGNTEWAAKHADALKALCEALPSGSGFDAGSELDLEASTSDKLVFNTSYHHMDDGGYYDGWTEHTVVLTPAFELGYHIKVTGQSRNEIKDYIAETFSYVLGDLVPEWMGYETPTAETAKAS